jgi:opacity protein-like surface antigen
MRKHTFWAWIAFGIACLLAAMLLPADASDLAPRVVQKAEPPVVVTGPTSGFYIGAYVAGAANASKFDSLSLNLQGSGDLHPIGFVPGFTAGYRWWTGAGEIGFEADGGYDFASHGIPCNFGVNNCSMKSAWLFTQRVKLGAALPALTGALNSSRAGQALDGRVASPSQWPIPITVAPSIGAATIVPYVTGGIAEIDEKACIAGVDNGCAHRFLVGWTAGGGLDVVIASKWDLGLEYLYVGLNKHFNPTNPDVSVFPDSFKAENVQMIRAKLNYHFGG